MVKVSIISLGCPRNQLDSEVIAGSLKKRGFSICDAEDGVWACIVNTCAFIQSAREESIEKILEASRLKKEGKVKYLIVCGCLPQLYKERLADALHEADLVLGTADFPKIPDLLKNIGKLKARSVISPDPNYLYDEYSPRIAFTPPHYAYLKISEGCSNFCSYCIISRLRGAFRSRSINSILEEAKRLAKPGTLKEIDLIGQDTTLFGIDRYGKAMFAEMLRRLCGLKNGVRWIRIMYTHPAHYSDELISVIRGEKKICKYLDLPIQHISDDILKKMNRHVAKKDIIKLISVLRKAIPGLALRTSIIVGFPGETDKDFKELLEFVRCEKFERLGAFTYSREDGTRASRFENQIPQEVKSQRFDELMGLQQKISSGINRSFIGKTVDVLIDEKLPTTPNHSLRSGSGRAHNAPRSTLYEFIGRTQYDAPEIDGAVRVSGKNIKVGEFYKVLIKDSLEYDLVGDKV